MTSANTFPPRLTKIDDLSRTDHYYLSDSDSCFFVGEYTARGGFAFSATNNLIQNFKKPMNRQGLPEWRYKARAISTAADVLRLAIGAPNLSSLTFVPVPPSKCKTDPLYDDRLIQMLHLLRPNPPLDIRELIVQGASTPAAHESDDRPNPDQVAAGYSINPALVLPTPQLVVLVDDVLTTGSHFKGAQRVLTAALPNVPIIGLFIARRVPNAAEFFDVIGDAL